MKIVPTDETQNRIPKKLPWWRRILLLPLIYSFFNLLYIYQFSLPEFVPFKALIESLKNQELLHAGLVILNVLLIHFVWGVSLFDVPNILRIKNKD